MKFIELAKKRYSCRKYDSKPVEDEKLEQVLEAGRIAPSAVNLQPWVFVVIRETENLKKIRSTYHREWFATAPCVIVALGNHEQSWKRQGDGKDHADIDVTIAIDHMTLQAAEIDLATCWVCNFDKQKVMEVLNLPDNLEPVALLPIGYPLDSPHVNRHDSKRKQPEEIVFYEKLS
jgi:nitroreductase